MWMQIFFKNAQILYYAARRSFSNKNRKSTVKSIVQFFKVVVSNGREYVLF